MDINDVERESQPDMPEAKRVSRPKGWAMAAGVLLFLELFVALFFAFRPPTQFPIGQRVEIPTGTSLVASARLLAQHHVVRSALLLQLLLIGRFPDANVQAGIYRFDRPLSALEVAQAVTSGTHLMPLARITIPEGLRTAEIVTLVREKLPNIPIEAFTLAAFGREGFLFPDTYHVPETFTAEQFVTLMQDTFTDKTAPLEPVFATSLRSRENIIIMASLLEREADTEESMAIISGILWKRLDRGIPLQVDASFAYLLGKESAEVTLDDLQIDSPYNTYKYKGLPPAPLNNPGLQAIQAALSPTPSPYFYYLTAPDGTYHYAKTFDEHKANKARYLK